jgi:hypothetical protein
MQSERRDHRTAEPKNPVRGDVERMIDALRKDTLDQRRQQATFQRARPR